MKALLNIDSVKCFVLICIFLLISCSTEKAVIDSSDRPSKNEFDRGGLIKRPDGPENRKRWEYYNGLQHKQNRPIRNK